MLLVNCLSRLSGIILGLTFVMIFPITVWIFNMNRTGLQAETYLEALSDQSIYEQLTPLILPALAEGNVEREVRQGRLNFRSVIENLKPQDWEAITQEIIPPSYVRQQAERNLTVFFAYINGEEAYFDLEFDTSILRQNLLGRPGDQMISRIAASWNPCRPEQEATLQAFLNEQTADFPYCRPASSELQRGVFTALSDAKDEIAQELPETWNARVKYAERNDLTLRDADIFYYEALQRPIALSRELYPMAFLIPSGLLAMILITSVTSTKSFFAWMGWPLILTGILTLLPLMIVPLIVTGLSTGPSNRPTTESDITVLQEQAFNGMILSLVRSFSMPILIQGAALVGGGFLLTFIAFLMPQPGTLMFSMEGSSANYPRNFNPMTGSPININPMTSGSITPTPTPTPTSARTPPPEPENDLNDPS